MKEPELFGYLFLLYKKKMCLCIFPCLDAFLS